MHIIFTDKLSKMVAHYENLRHMMFELNTSLDISTIWGSREESIQYNGQDLLAEKTLDICVGRSRNLTCQERHAKDMLILTCWRAKYGKTVQRIFTSRFATYCIYIYVFLCDAGTKKLFVSFNYHVLIGKYCK